MEADKETLLAWLQDAHAMENQAIEILKRQSERIKSYPDLQEKVPDHLEETREHAARVKECIERLGGDASTTKKSVGKFMGNAAALANSAANDEVVKDGIADYAFEQFEIASYRALIAAAEQLGEDEIRRVCEEILEEEKAMAQWLEEKLPLVTRQYLEHRVKV